jgi:hypothetical protein
MPEINIRVESCLAELGILNDVMAQVVPAQSQSILRFTPKASLLSKGIIAFLTRKCGGNAHDRDCVLDFSDSVASEAADLSGGGYLGSQNAPSQSLGYDFKQN